MTFPAISAVANVLAHAPALVRYGSKPLRDSLMRRRRSTRSRFDSGILAPRIVAVVLALVICWSAEVSAQGQRDIAVERMVSEKRVALVIGNAAYASPAVLRNPSTTRGTWRRCYAASASM